MFVVFAAFLDREQAGKLDIHVCRLRHQQVFIGCGRVLQQTVNEDDIRARELVEMMNPVKQCLAAVHDHLESQRVQVAAGTA